MEYSINKGIGKSAEFKGLTSQYLFIFAGGLLAIFILVIIFYMAGIDQFVCISLGVITALILVGAVFYLNQVYGEHGLMKLLACLNRPRFIINRRKIRVLINAKKRRDEK